jgi:hypothetical protein
MRKLSALLLVMAALAFGAAPAFGGQPNVECGDPGSHPVAGFGTGGFENAESHYAGSENTPSANNAQSSHAVSQYDIACFGGHGNG